MQAANAGDTLLIRNGTYRGTGFHSIDWPYEKNLVLRAETDSLVTINCKGNAFLFFSQSTEQANKVRGLKIINANPAFTITKANTIIQDNILVSGRGLIIVNDPNNRVVIRGNTFRNMSAVLSQVGGCTFLQNNTFIRCSSKEDTCLLSVIHADSLLVKENLFVQNRLTLLVSDSVRTVLCNNNTIICNSSLPLWVKGSRCLRIKNNIFYKNQLPKSTNKLFYAEENEPCYKVAYNCCFGNTNDNLGKGPQFVRNKVSDPGLGTDYTPLWTSTAKSICIDNGDPDTNGDGANWATDVKDQDGDGTRKDIGAKPTITHGNYVTTLTRSAMGTGTSNYNWICFPYMDKLYNSGSPETNEYIFHTYHGNNLLVTQPSVLNTIEWKYNSDAGTVIHGQNGWSNITNSVISQKGYKVLLATGQTQKAIESAGFLCGTSGNSNQTIHIDAKETGHAYREIWVGYFKETTADPLTALSEVVDSLIEIKTKNWALSRTAPGQAWLMSSENKVFQLGEAVSLRYVGKRAIDFSWQVPSGNDDEPPEEMASVQHFNYEEQADYIPFFVKLGNNKSIPTKGAGELALYVNGECYGAEVVQGDTVQINGYILGLANLEQANVEFRYWNGNEKSGEMKISKYVSYNQDYSLYENRPIELNTSKHFYVASLDSQDATDASVPKITMLEANYPNPFNPETTIKYSIAKAGKVNLSIYNAKGQLVRTLVNESMEPGFRSIVWKGENNNGNKVSSGVYFYHLKTADRVITKKMLLMK